MKERTVDLKRTVIAPNSTPAIPSRLMVRSAIQRLQHEASRRVGSTRPRRKGVFASQAASEKDDYSQGVILPRVGTETSGALQSGGAAVPAVNKNEASPVQCVYMEGPNSEKRAFCAPRFFSNLRRISRPLESDLGCLLFVSSELESCAVSAD